MMPQNGNRIVSLSDGVQVCGHYEFIEASKYKFMMLYNYKLIV